MPDVFPRLKKEKDRLYSLTGKNLEDIFRDFITSIVGEGNAERLLVPSHEDTHETDIERGFATRRKKSEKRISKAKREKREGATEKTTNDLFEGFDKPFTGRLGRR